VDERDETQGNAPEPGTPAEDTPARGDVAAPDGESEPVAPTPDRESASAEAGPDGGTASGDEDGLRATSDEAATSGDLASEETAPEEPAGPSAAQVRAIVEALVFASPQPITARELGRVLAGVPKETWLQAIEELKADYAREDRGLQMIEVAGGWQITTRPEHNDWVRELLDPRTPTRLSIQALETLAVIAYRQPVTLPEIIDLRGVRSQGVVKTLLEKHLIRIMGRKEVVGRPMLYGTTKHFLLHFGLKDLEELPKVEEFAEVLGEEVDIPGLKRAIEAPKPVEVPLGDGEGEPQITLFGEDGEGDAEDGGSAVEDGEGDAEDE